jgi:uncharacterized Zn finger protein
MARYRGGYGDFGYFPPSVPREAKGGIRAHTQRGAFASTWWGRRWIEVLEGFGLGARLGRGQRYARKGQVLTLEIEPGSVAATVQGSRARPYRVRVRLEPLPESAWAEIVERLAGDVGLGARLLAGEMPQEVEEVVEAAGARLFPDRFADLETACSCPDWSNPCKHVAAVHYLLAEELDRDPFLLFRLRGKEREALTADLLDAGRGGAALDAGDRGDALGSPASAVDRQASNAHEGFSWPSDPDAFWGRPAAGTDEEIGVDAAGPDPGEPFLPTVPAIHAALARRLGPFPFWRGERPFLEGMTELYRKASVQARELLSSDRSGP